MNDQRRRFKPRSQRNGYRGRNSRTSNNKVHFQSNGNIGRANGSMTNPFNVEKTMQKYLQLAKDALSSGDPVLHQNYLQHADHYLRRYNELNERRENTVSKIDTEEKSIPKEKTDKENQTVSN